MNYKIVKIDERTWRIENIFVYCFLLVGKERAVMIDSGCDIENIKGVVEEILKENGLDEFLNKPIEVITTHGDGDHTHGHGEFAAFYITRDDYEIFEFNKRFPNTQYNQITDGQVIDIGERPLQIITVPGHTKGSIAILDINNRKLFSGDMVQTGRIFQFGTGRTNDELKNSYEKLESFYGQFDRIYPNHAEPELEPEYISKIKAEWENVLAGKVKFELQIPDSNAGWPDGFVIKAYKTEHCTFLLPKESTYGEKPGIFAASALTADEKANEPETAKNNNVRDKEDNLPEASVGMPAAQGAPETGIKNKSVMTGEETMENQNVKKKTSGFRVTVVALLVAILVIIAASAVIVIPKTTKLMDLATEEMVKMDTIIDGVDEAITNINKVDFDDLSESVSSLKTIVTSIANFFSIFK